MTVMKNYRELLWLILLLLCPMQMSAQFTVNNPKEKFSINASVEGVTNTNYKWKTDDRDFIARGQMERGMEAHVTSSLKLVSIPAFSLTVSPFYNYSARRLDTNWADGDQKIISAITNNEQPMDLPTQHHHYGGSLSASLNFMVGEKAMTIMATGTANMSQYGFENVSGVVGTIVHLIREKDTYLAVGAIYLIANNVSWPLYPFFAYRHQFNNRWSVNCLEANNYVYYHASPKVKLALGTEMDIDRIYFRPKSDVLPKKSVYSLVSERGGMFANFQATKELSFNLGMGVSVPLFGRVREPGHRHSYMRLDDKVKPFIQLKARYAIMKP